MYASTLHQNYNWSFNLIFSIQSTQLSPLPVTSSEDASTDTHVSRRLTCTIFWAFRSRYGRVAEILANCNASDLNALFQTSRRFKNNLIRDLPRNMFKVEISLQMMATLETSKGDKLELFSIPYLDILAMTVWLV
ncbi:hypothetical protein L3Y34_005122 [Caenorhabditis briggsae]|uniref:Uncharacterized protein n=1 Tax=Caenorhabditis briggsae TaxID=6238 RepID=A0AAE9ADW2_CAEBR|nr:hypothetical protein L3Y34_005122 [Caenorhabditis briggsae]